MRVGDAILVDSRSGALVLDWGDSPRLIVPGIREWGRRMGVSLMAGFSDATEKLLIDHVVNKTAHTSATQYLALTTIAVVDADTSATITEANYTGYARLNIPGSDWNAATGTTAAATTANQKLFAACTAGSSTVIGWALSPISTTAGAGNITFFGTCASTVISTTATPATVNAGGLSVGLD